MIHFFAYQKKIVKELEKELPFDEQGNVIIRLNVYNDDSFLSPYSGNDKPLINSEVASFIENKKDAFLLSRNIKIQILSDCIDENKKEIYRQAFKNYYESQNRKDRYALAKNYFFSIVMASIGIFILALMVTLASFFNLGIWEEVIDIFGTVFIWEAVGLFFIERRSIRQDYNASKAFKDAIIEFIDKK